jgi:hypothetical protein
MDVLIGPGSLQPLFPRCPPNDRVPVADVRCFVREDRFAFGGCDGRMYNPAQPRAGPAAAG